MHNVHSLHPPQEAATLHSGHVKGGSAGTYMVQTPNGILMAHTAASCLVQPETEDHVLVARQTHQTFILAVLERKGKTLTIDLGGDTRIGTSGSLSIESDKTLTLHATDQVQLSSLSVNLVAGLAFLTAQTLKLRAPQVDADHDEVTFRTRRLSSWAQQVLQHADSVMRWVETVETANIGQWVNHVRQAYLLHAQHATLTARGDVRVDGERIHMG